MPPARRRQVSARTQKILYALSGNRCAYPQCLTPLVHTTTNANADAQIGEICHIYSASPNGPRGDGGLPSHRLNSPENLVLFCPTHHTLVDTQPDRHPASLLKTWKATRENHQLSDITTDLARSTPIASSLATRLIDAKIVDVIDSLRKSRFLHDSRTRPNAAVIAHRVHEGEYCFGSAPVRARALAWCARLLSSSDLPNARRILGESLNLTACPENQVAHAFCLSHSGDRHNALAALALINMPLSRSAALFVVAHHDGDAGAIAWLSNAGLPIADLDADGKAFLLAAHLRLGDYDAAHDVLGSLTDTDTDDAPFLHYLTGLLLVADTVPEELRPTVLRNTPFAAREFALAATPDAIQARRRARDCFVEAANIGRRYHCPDFATHAQEYALWIDLRDPEHAADGRRRLASLLQGPRPQLRFVHLGLEFGLDLNIPAIEQEIARTLALHGGGTQDAALARFSLTLIQSTPADVADYISRHIDQLSRHLDEKAVRLVQIEALARDNSRSRALECLETLRSRRLLNAVDEQRIQRILDETENQDPVRNREEQYLRSGSLVDLHVLVRALEDARNWPGLRDYAARLYDATNSLEDATRLATALYNVRDFNDLLQLLEANPSFLRASDDLRLLYCCALYETGQLLSCKAAMADVISRTSEHYRQLRVGLALALGDRNELALFVAEEVIHRDRRTPTELLADAQLAVHLGLPAARELTFSAAHGAGDDPNILVACYSLATSCGWEDESSPSGWIQQALKLSTPDGPVRSGSLQEMAARAPKWARHEADTWEQLALGKIPLFVAAHGLNRTLVKLHLVPALLNCSQSDPRRRDLVPAYSGAREPLLPDPAHSLGLTPTALLTLGFLGALDQVIECFGALFIPQTTLPWLLREGREVLFHQPSRVRDARQLQDLVSAGRVRPVVSTVAPEPTLLAQVGDELAGLLTDATVPRARDARQRLVVRSSPVYRVGSLMTDQCDLRSYQRALTGCKNVVDRLRELGRLPAADADRANAYLALHESPWPNPPTIQADAVLYLDDLTIAYFTHLGILDVVTTAGFAIFVSALALQRTSELISYDQASTDVANVIESITAVLSRRLAEGAVQVVPTGRSLDADDGPMMGHPSLALPALGARCESIATDDRFFNRYPRYEMEEDRAEVHTTLDLLGTLERCGALRTEEKWAYLTRLRTAQYVFVPVDVEEILHYLLASAVLDDGTLQESMELRALRENLLCARMSIHLGEEEAAWLRRTLATFGMALKRCWTSSASAEDARARSNWIWEQIDCRLWSHCFRSSGPDAARQTLAFLVAALAFLPAEACDDRRQAYEDWLTDICLEPLRLGDPDLYDWVVELHRRGIEEGVMKSLVENNEEAE